MTCCMLEVIVVAMAIWMLFSGLHQKGGGVTVILFKNRGFNIWGSLIQRPAGLSPGAVLLLYLAFNWCYFARFRVTTQFHRGAIV